MESFPGTTPITRISIVEGLAATSIYNQNIIPQAGLFIFNPFSQRSIDELFNVEPNTNGWNLALSPMDKQSIHRSTALKHFALMSLTEFLESSF